MSAPGPALLPALFAGLTCLAPLRGQAPPQPGGRADLAIQGYYFRVNEAFRNVSGLAAEFQHFVPRLGLLAGKLEDYAGEGRWRAGDNLLELRGAVWQDHRWTLTGGDFRVPTGPSSAPLGNIFYPELSLRGARVTASRENREYSLFYGAYTLYAGPRIPFHTTTPQRVLGASFRYRPRQKLELEFRLLRLSTDLSRTSEDAFLFPVGRRLPLIHTAALQAGYSLTQRLRVFAEASFSSTGGRAEANPVAARPMSVLAGAAWESEKWTLRGGMVRQGALYLPLAGYFSGDRKGPSAEVRYRPIPRLELSSSASAFSNNLERDDRVATYRTTLLAHGVSAELPWKLTVDAHASRLRFESNVQHSDNRMWSVGAARPLGSHHLRFALREIRSRTTGQTSTQRSREVEDTFRWKGIVLGAALRLDSTVHRESRNSVFARGHAQINLRRVSAHANVEHGRDLINETVFATSAVSSSTIGLSAPVPGGWRVHAEAFRSRLSSALNPENVFLLETRGAGFPVLLAAFHQWSFYFRLTRTLRWGEPLPEQGLDRFTAERIPIAGAIEGFVHEQGPAKRSAAGVTVTLDGHRKAATGPDGRYRFEDVAEGAHRLGFSIEELPADYEPGPVEPEHVLVRSRRTTRADLHVFRLGEICGRVQGPPDTPLEAVILRLSPASRYTTPEADGAFCFYNLREGEYTLDLDTGSLPPNIFLRGEGRVGVVLDLSRASESPEFHLERRVIIKPVRQVLTRLD